MIPANHWLSMVRNMSGNYCFVPETSHNLGHTIVNWGKGGGGGGAREIKEKSCYSTKEVQQSTGDCGMTPDRMVHQQDSWL